MLVGIFFSMCLYTASCIRQTGQWIRAAHFHAQLHGNECFEILFLISFLSNFLSFLSSNLLALQPCCTRWRRKSIHSVVHLHSEAVLPPPSVSSTGKFCRATLFYFGWTFFDPNNQNSPRLFKGQEYVLMLGNGLRSWRCEVGGSKAGNSKELFKWNLN